jgi:hypothetical protein
VTRRALRAPRDGIAWLRRNRASVAALVVASALPLSLRLVHMAEDGLPLQIFDIGGGLGDLGVELAVSLMLALAWRASFDRPAAVQAVAEAIRAIRMPCLKFPKAA